MHKLSTSTVYFGHEGQSTLDQSTLDLGTIVSLTRSFVHNNDRQQAVIVRWYRLKAIVDMAEKNPTVDDALKRVEMLYELYK